MNRDRIIYFVVLLSVFAACFAVYQFYFKAKLEKYAQDKQLLENLNSTYSSLSGAFRGEDPDTVIAQYRSVVQSWRDAIDARVGYFNDAEWRDYQNPPEDVFILQYWYGERTREMTAALWEKAQGKYGAEVYQRFPADIQGMLGVPYAEQWQGYDIQRSHVTSNLERLSYGISVLDLLLDSNAQAIRQVAMYDPQPSRTIGADVVYHRLGVSFVIEVKDFVGMIEKFRAADRYFNIEGMKVTHPYIAVRYEPRLEVEMFIVRTKPKESFLAGTVAAGGPASNVQQAFSAFSAGGGAPLQNPFRLQGDDDEEYVREPEPTGVARAWRWFKRTVLFTN
ncbi:MAG: hypothetical protein KF886_08055 [Candidatus Hydrogenedentes bacterium]|nr:hypothetical protein [Candidatus Hydrogenedentota bacterium]